MRKKIDFLIYPVVIAGVFLIVSNSYVKGEEDNNNSIPGISRQEIPHLEHLSHRGGKVETYYTKSSESKAEYLQMLVEDAMLFYEDELKDTFDLTLIVPDRKAWKYFASAPYPLSEFRRDPARIILPDASIYKIKLPRGRTLFGMSKVYFWDLIAAHELGHYISVRFNARSHTLWLGEFFADYIQIGYMAEKVPEFHFPQWWFSLWTILPFKYKTLEDLRFDRYINPANYSFFQAKFFELASGIFEKRGYSFIHDYINYFSKLNEHYSNKDVDKPGREEIMDISISYLKNTEPELFNSWHNTMRKGPHYYFIAIGLIIMVILMIIINRSYHLIKYLAITSKAVMIISMVCLFFWITLFILVRI